MKRSAPIVIDWKPDKSRAVPVYRQIVQFVCDKVARGDWPVGTRLPPQRALAALFGVNRSTVTAAIDELVSYGIVAGNRSAGAQIVSDSWSLLLPSAPDWSKMISSGFFRENDRTIQEINRLEFVPDMIRLGTGELDPRLFPAEMWQSILQKLSGEVSSLGYLEPLGLPTLRQAIAAHMETLGIHTSPSCILVTSGALQGLQLISASLLPSGSTVFTEAPTYLKSLRVFQSAGMKLSGLPMDGDGLSLRALSAALDAKSLHHPAILYTIPTNQNPTGLTMPAERRRALMALCAESRLPVIEDGAYHELCYNTEAPLPLKAFDQSGNVLYLGSASKTLAPGLRVGWVIAPEPIVQRLGDIKMQTDYGASSVSQWIFAKFLTSGLYRRYLDELRGELCRRRDGALAALEQHFSDLASWYEPTGGFYIWLTFKEDVPIDHLFERAVRKHILLNPGDIYDFTRSRSLRLSFSYTTSAEFETAISQLAQMLRSGDTI